MKDFKQRGSSQRLWKFYQLLWTWNPQPKNTLLLIANRAEAEKQAQRLINNLEHRQIPHAPESVRPYVTMSIGIAQLSAKQDVDNYHTLLEAADDALYKAKENGRNQLAWAIEEE